MGTISARISSFWAQHRKPTLQNNRPIAAAHRTHGPAWSPRGRGEPQDLYRADDGREAQSAGSGDTSGLVET